MFSFVCKKDKMQKKKTARYCAKDILNVFMTTDQSFNFFRLFVFANFWLKVVILAVVEIGWFVLFMYSECWYLAKKRFYVSILLEKQPVYGLYISTERRRHDLNYVHFFVRDFMHNNFIKYSNSWM